MARPFGPFLRVQGFGAYPEPPRGFSAEATHLLGAGLGVVLGGLRVHVLGGTDDQGGGGADNESHLAYEFCGREVRSSK